MRNPLPERLEAARITKGEMASTILDGPNGAFIITRRLGGSDLRIIASDGLGWEHVSVSLVDRLPTWPEMCFVKDLFWRDDECAVQYHPARANYVNCHPNTLHMWRPVDAILPQPPSIMVGPK